MDVMHAIFVRAFGVRSEPSCRRCLQPIRRSDEFGLSERVCGPCRGEPDGRR